MNSILLLFQILDEKGQIFTYTFPIA